MTIVLPDPVAILAQMRRSSVGWENVDVPVGGWRFGLPDQCFDGFELTEEKAAGFEIFRVSPVVRQEALRGPGDADSLLRAMLTLGRI